LVNLRDVEYADIKIFFQTMYSNYNVMRKNIKLETCNPFITGTIGCASFPHDADNYDELFQLMDKTLYRGKTKGRNCYIIYLESKHKDLQIKELAKHGMYESLHNLVDRFEIRDNTVDKLRDMYNVLEEVLRITNLYYVDSKNVVHDIMGNVDEVPVSDISAVMTTDMFNTNSVDIINDLSPEFYGFLKKNEIEALLIVRIRVNHDIYGYLMCAEPRSLRIWQEDEAALLFFAARLLASHIRETGDGL
nr:hypothetical protein [Eubacterium sp.]